MMKIKSFLILFFSIFLLNPLNAMAATSNVTITDLLTCSTTTFPCDGTGIATNKIACVAANDTFTISINTNTVVATITCSAAAPLTDPIKQACVYQCMRAKQMLKKDIVDELANVSQNSFTKNACNILRIATGSAGKTFSAFAVIATGIGFFTGKVSWGLMIGVTAGIATMFGAPSVIAAITGQSSNMLCDINL